MTFSDTIFLFLFLPALLAVYYLCAASIRPYILLLASFLFYACGDPKYFFLIAVASVGTVAVGYAMSHIPEADQTKRRVLLVCGVAANTGILIYYKYTDFVLSNLSKLAGSEYTMKGIALPLGISFFVFKAISYLADVYRGKVQNGKSPVHAMLYLTIFTQISSGPLARADSILPDILGGGCRPSWNKFCDGMSRFVIGFCKKILLSNTLSDIVTWAFAANPVERTTAQAWMGAICFSLQLFYDFAGYSDMAIGLTKMFGYDCPENFIYPYATRSISEFWRRWHVTLGAWFRDYVYIPLGGSRVDQKWKLYRNLFTVWLLTGLWHGANWTFVVWGLGYFLLIAAEKATGMPERLTSRVARVAYRIASLFCINLLWVVFRAENLEAAWQYIQGMFCWRADPIVNARAWFLIKDNAAFLICAVLFAMPLVPWIRKKCKECNGNRVAHVACEGIFAIASMILFCWAISYMVAGANNPFIYANF